MPENNQIMSPRTMGLKATAKVVPVLLLLLLVGAICFYKERMLFIDAPHVLFRIINDGRFWIEEHRYGAFISQLLPWICIKLHFPLSVLVVLYSAGFYLFFLSVVLLLVYRYRNYGLALLFGFYFTLFVSESFYWSNNEVHQGIGWLMLAFATNFFIAEKKRPWAGSIFFFIVSFGLAIWTHPLVMLVAVFLWFFLWLGKIYWPFTTKQSVIYTVILLLLCYFKYSQASAHGYDGTKIEAVTQFQPARIKAILSSPMLHFFVKGCITNYWLFVLISAAGFIALIRERKYLLLAFTAAYSTGYLLLVCITFWDLNTNRFYIESEYMPLSVICCAPFVYYVLPKFNWKASTGLIIVIFTVRLVYIFFAAAPFTSRIMLLQKMNDKMKVKQLTKVLIPEPVGFADSVLMMKWAAPVESIMLSRLNGEVPQRTFIFAASDLINAAKTTGNDTMLGCWEKRPVNRLNSVYFQLDTTRPYSVVNFETLME